MACHRIMIYDLGTRKPIVWRLEGVKMCRVATNVTWDRSIRASWHQGIRASGHQSKVMLNTRNGLDYSIMSMLYRYHYYLCSSIDIRVFFDFKCCLSLNIIYFIKPVVIQGLFLWLNLLYFTSFVVYFYLLRLLIRILKYSL